MKNKGIEMEKMASRYGFILNSKSNATASTAADAIDLKGRTHQLKSDKATIANNYRRELGNDKIKEAKQLLTDDYSEMVTLIANYNGTTIFYSFTKESFKEMITEQPEILYYDTASKRNGGKTTIRLKVKKKYDRYYRTYAEERVEV